MVALMTQWIAIAAAAATFALAYNTIQYKGVQKERSRVETQGAKTDVKAQGARKSAQSRADGVLTKYYRD
jgi:hypothetical protein